MRVSEAEIADDYPVPQVWPSLLPGAVAADKCPASVVRDVCGEDARGAGA